MILLWLAVLHRPVRLHTLMVLVQLTRWLIRVVLESGIRVLVRPHTTGISVRFRGHWPGDGKVLRTSTVVLNVRIPVALRRLKMLLLKARWRHVLFPHRRPLFRCGIMPNAARTAAVGNVIVVDDRSLMDNRLVHIGVVDSPLIHAHHCAVVPEIMAVPFTAHKSNAHVAEAIVHAAVIANVATPVSGVEQIQPA